MKAGWLPKTPSNRVDSAQTNGAGAWTCLPRPLKSASQKRCIRCNFFLARAKIRRRKRTCKQPNPSKLASGRKTSFARNWDSRSNSERRTVSILSTRDWTRSAIRGVPMSFPLFRKPWKISTPMSISSATNHLRESNAPRWESHNFRLHETGRTATPRICEQTQNQNPCTP